MPLPYNFSVFPERVQSTRTGKYSARAILPRRTAARTDRLALWKRLSSATNCANGQARSAGTPFFRGEPPRNQTGTLRGNALLSHAANRRAGEIGLTRRTSPPRRTAPKRSPAPQTRFPRARRRKSSASAPYRWDARIPMRRPPACTEARPTWADPGHPA